MAKEKTNLVIVESPAKARTIEKYLGSNYKVTASMGHLRDLPKSAMGVDIEGGFIPEYIPVKGREDIIDDLKKKAKGSGIVYLATDPDREGEAISWHLKELLELPGEKAKRVTFNEITKKVVSESIQNPRDIDQDLVDAQQARRILDRIVGYKLSPLLWRKVRRGLSAGRVQSVATRMVVDKEGEIRVFEPEEFWRLDVWLSLERHESRFMARFYGTRDKKLELKSETEVLQVEEALKISPFTVGSVKRSEKSRSPQPPFITSTLQQEASRRLGMAPRKAMMIAQQLYEGVDITGEGTIGLITYMRTDSLRLSEEALSQACGYIERTYGKEFYPGTPRRFKKGKGSQDAHEAIRPSDVWLSPDRVRKDLTNDQYRLYRLIWGRFVASQMSNAVYDVVAVDVYSARYVFRANHSVIKFAGFTSVYEEGKDEEPEEKESPLPELREGENLKLEKIDKEQKFTQPPSRFTEATLIKAMEEKGIGRPSTYAPTISTIINREYVAKEGKILRPTALGEVVTSLMKERFPDIVDLKFTADMEKNLDSIEEGICDWKSILDSFYTGFNRELADAEHALEGEHIKIPDEVTSELCDKCGKNLVVKSGRFGRFLACPGYPECNFTKPIVVEMPGMCPKCGSRILKRTSKKGYTYYGCEKYQDCGFMTWDVPVKDICPECGKAMFKRSGRGALKPFCVNESCPNFLPEDKRGYKKKSASSTEADKESDNGKQDDKKTAAKKDGKTKKGSSRARGKVASGE